MKKIDIVGAFVGLGLGLAACGAPERTVGGRIDLAALGRTEAEVVALRADGAEITSELASDGTFELAVEAGHDYAIGFRTIERGRTITFANLVFETEAGPRSVVHIGEGAPISATAVPSASRSSCHGMSGDDADAGVGSDDGGEIALFTSVLVRGDDAAVLEALEDHTNDALSDRDDDDRPDALDDDDDSDGLCDDEDDHDDVEGDGGVDDDGGASDAGDDNGGNGDEPGDDHGGNGDEPGDDNGGNGDEPGDDHGGNGDEPGDDNGGNGDEPGDDNGGNGNEPGDDNGGNGNEPGDDNGGSGSGSGSGDDGGAELPYGVRLGLGDTFTMMDAFAAEGELPAEILDMVMEGGDWRLAELSSGVPFTVTEADCTHAGNRGTGRDRIFVSWRNADGTTELDHVDLRYCGR